MPRHHALIIISTIINIILIHIIIGNKSSYKSKTKIKTVNNRRITVSTRISLCSSKQPSFKNAMAPADNSSEVKEKIARDLNERAGLKHNYGQPKRAPHAAQDHTAAKFLTSCSEEHSNSLKCIERNYQNRSACEPFFQAYKTCRKEENRKRLEENEKKANQNGGFSFF